MFDLVGIRLAGSRPAFQWASLLPTVGANEAFVFFFSKTRLDQKHHTVSVSTGTLPFVCVTVVAAHRTHRAEVSPSPLKMQQIFPSLGVNFPVASGTTVVSRTPGFTQELIMSDPYWFVEGWHLERWLHVSRSVNIKAHKAPKPEDCVVSPSTLPGIVSYGESEFLSLFLWGSDTVLSEVFFSLILFLCTSCC